MTVNAMYPVTLQYSSAQLAQISQYNFCSADYVHYDEVKSSRNCHKDNNL
jgi:hypothetical protein